MKNRYHTIMEHLTVTDEMQARILKHINAVDLNKIDLDTLDLENFELDTFDLNSSDSKSNKMKPVQLRSYRKLVPIAAALLLLLVSAVLLPNLLTSDTIPDDTPVQVIPDIVEYDSVSELSTAVGFEVQELDALPFTADQTTFIAYWKELAQITYSTGDDSVTFRQSMGTEDNSGDYNTYDIINEIPVNDVIVSMKGTEAGYVLAVWTDGTYSYSLAFSGSVSKDVLLGIISTFD